MTSRTQDVWAEHYSPRNVMTLFAAGATNVAGYREWQEQGRQVRRGEHGIQLVAPVVKKDDDGNPRVVNMRTVTVFDISQTDPMPAVRTPAMALQDAVSGRIAEGEAEAVIEQPADDFARETRATQAMFADMEDQELI